MQEYSAGPAQMFNFSNVHRTEIGGPDDFVAPAVRRLYEWWLGFAPDIPQRSDFDVLELTDVAAHLFLVRMVDHDVFEYRLRGERVAELVGVRGGGDRYGREDADEGSRQLADYYQTIVQSRTPMRCLGTFVEEVSFATAFESVDCPLVDENGAVTHIIGAMDKVPSAYVPS